MKNLILLFLVIGAAVSQVVLTTGTATAAIEWTLTYATPTGENFYGYTLSVKAKDLSAATVAANTALFTGVVCLETLSTFDDSTAGPGWVWAVTSPNAVASVLGTAAGFTTLTLTYLPALAITETGVTNAGAANTGAGGIICTITAASPATVTSGVANSMEYITTAINSCGNLKAMGVAFYARCYNVIAQATDFAGTSAVAIASIDTGTNVTVTATSTTTTCTTTGASTLATGATILAGIAYLQF